MSPSFFRFADGGKVYADGNATIPPSVSFYNDLSPKEAEFWTKKLTFSSFEALNATATYIPYRGDFKCVYVIGKRDNSVPPEFAQTYINQPGAQFTVEWLDAGHAPMLGQPGNVAKIIRKAAGEALSG